MYVLMLTLWFVVVLCVKVFLNCPIIAYMTNASKSTNMKTVCSMY